MIIVTLVKNEVGDYFVEIPKNWGKSLDCRTGKISRLPLLKMVWSSGWNKYDHKNDAATDNKETLLDCCGGSYSDVEGCTSGPNANRTVSAPSGTTD